MMIIIIIIIIKKQPYQSRGCAPLTPYLAARFAGARGPINPTKKTHQTLTK